MKKTTAKPVSKAKPKAKPAAKSKITSTKKYLAAWSPKAYESSGTKTVSASFFSSKNGYDESDIAAIKKLRVGDVAKLDAGYHVVTRIS